MYIFIPPLFGNHIIIIMLYVDFFPNPTLFHVIGVVLTIAMCNYNTTKKIALILLS